MKNLYLIASPIGNLDDISQRAIETLKKCDLIIAENPSHTSLLLNHLNIKDKRYLQIAEFHNKNEINGKLISVEAENIAYLSDAGTPNLSDPGGKLAEIARQLNWKIVPIPGPSALTAMIATCGFPAMPFTFLGFPPNKKGRLKFFDNLNNYPHLVIIYESKHRIEKTLAQLPPDRLICVGREITKLHEEFIWGYPHEIINQLKSSKGEFCIACAPRDYVK